MAAVISEAGNGDDSFYGPHLDPYDTGTVVEFHGTNDHYNGYNSALNIINTIANGLGVTTDFYTYPQNYITGTSGNTVDFFSYTGYGHSNIPDDDQEKQSAAILFDHVISGDQCPSPSMNVPQIAW